MAERVEQAERSLADATALRQKTIDNIKNVQKELDGLVKHGTRKPRETIAELDDRLKKLERDRTIVSIPLKQEKEILLQMSRVERLKRQVEEFQTYDKLVKSKKSDISRLRDELRVLGERVSELRTELLMAQKAKELGCTVEELLGMKVDCPQEKLGVLIGKKGQNVKQLQEMENVSIDVGRKDGAVRILGSLESLDSAALNIDRVLAKVEESVELPKPLIFFLTAKGISALSEIQSRHPDVDIDVQRDGQTRLRGVPDDLQSAKNDLKSVEIVEQKISVTAYESALVIGKQGATVNSLVERHQAAVEVTRAESDDVPESTIAVVGSLSCVKDAIEEIEDLLAQHKEETRNIPVDPLIKELLLMNKGVGMQALFKLVNDGCRELLPGVVSVAIEDLSVRVKAKSLVVEKAVEIVQDEIRLRESSIVKISIHPSVVPALIGKGGAGIKKLKEGTENVMVDVDRKEGRVAVCSVDSPEGTEKVVQALKTFADEHQVESVELEPNLFQNQFRLLLRSSHWKDLNGLVSVSRDDTLFQILLRGNKENIGKAKDILLAFLEEHFQDVIPVSDDDLGALMRRGKKSKVDELAKAHSVRLNTGEDRSSVVLTGKKEDVAGARKAVECFLNGGDGTKVIRMTVDDVSAGILVGRGGSTKAAIEDTFSSVSMSILQNLTVVIRGEEKEVDACQKHIAKLLSSSYISERLALDEKMQKATNTLRAKLKSVPVQATFDEMQVIVRGTRPDVHYAMAQLKDTPYENRVFLEASCFQKVHNMSRDSQPSFLQNASRTKVDFDPKTSSIIISGKRENVVTAKKQLIQFLSFVLPETFVCDPVPQHAMHFLGQAVQLGSMAGASGAFLYIDRDLDSIVISSFNPTCVKEARETFAAKSSGMDSAVYKVDVGDDADWLIPKLIGKNGARVKALRKSWECSVELDDKCVTIMSDDPDKLQNARQSLDDIIAKERAEYLLVELPNETVSAFLGHKGSAVKEFEKLHDVRVQAIRKQGTFLRITGNAEAVTKAKEALDAWLQGREQSADSDAVVVFNFEPSEGLILRRLIGKNGKRINALRKKCDCQIEIDVDRRFLKITSDEPERLDEAKKIVEEVLKEERSQNAVVKLPDGDLPAFIGTKGSNVREFESEYDVKVQVLKIDGGGLHIAGEAEAVERAKAGIQEWIAGRAELVPSSNATESGESDAKAESTARSPDRGRKENKPKSGERALESNNTNKASNSMSPPEKSEFPVLSSPQAGEAGGSEFTEKENTIIFVQEGDQSGQSWASILQNPPQGTAAHSAAEAVIRDELDGDGQAD